MKVFISWSGDRSNQVARALRTFLEDVNQAIEPWMSETDIDAGSRWGADLARQLDETNFGIICLAPESLSSSWLMFEAGALSKSVQGGRVCPYLIGMGRHEIQGPLAQFQSKMAVADQTYQMLEAINEAMGEEALSRDRLQRYFDRFWPELETAISTAISGGQYLPPDLLRRLVELLAELGYNRQLEMWFAYSGLPSYLVNWNQNMLNVASESVKIALKYNKFGELMKLVQDDYPLNPDLIQLMNDIPKEITS